MKALNTYLKPMVSLPVHEKLKVKRHCTKLHVKYSNDHKPVVFHKVFANDNGISSTQVCLQA